MALQKDTLNLADLEAKYGIAASMLIADTSLQEALNTIIKDGITDPDLQLATLKQTDWYKKNTDDWRKFQSYKLGNPSTFAVDLQNNAKSVAEKFAKAGINVDASTVVSIAEKMMMKSAIVDGKAVSYDGKYLNKMLAGAIDFTKTKTINNKQFYDVQGNLATVANGLYNAARDYGMDTSMTNQGFKNWFETNMRSLVAGDITAQELTDQLANNAVSMMPGLADQIRSGKTVRAAADPWINAIANELEVDPETIDLTDSMLQRAINNSDEKGNFSPRSLYDTKLMARKDPRWDYTSTAKKEKTGIAGTILRDFGFLG